MPCCDFLIGLIIKKIAKVEQALFMSLHVRLIIQHWWFLVKQYFRHIIKL